MPEFFNVLLNFMSQFAGGRGGIDHNVVQFGLAGILWGALLLYARDRRKEENPARERLLILGFSLGLLRELFMFGLAFILALKLVDHDLLHVVFPPLEHVLINAAMFVVASAFLLFLREDRTLAQRYMCWSLVSLLLCYFATFWWWGEHILADPSSTFGQTWCDWAFRLNASFWLFIALVLCLSSTRSRVRSLIALAFLLFFFSEFLKLPDMALGEVYEGYITPVRHSCYLFGILTLAFVYLREQVMERKKSKKQILKLAYYDPLTKLPNRLLFQDRLAQTIALASRSGNRFALLFLDLDRFKAINDTHGHASGDALLTATAARLKKCLRIGDSLARLSGDEFVLLLPDIGENAAAITVAEKILAQMGQEFQLNSLQVFSSVSIGVAFYPENGTDPEALLKHADMAMFAAKESGRSRFHLFSTEMHREIIQKYQIADELRLALQRQEFELHYQPQIDVLSEKIVGAEALIRWRHPTKGLILPGKFIPIAEEIGLIQPLGVWIFRTACQQLKCWLGQGLDDFKISINLSAHRLAEADFLSQVEAVLQETGVNPCQLELELTESTMFADIDKATALLKELKLRGFTLAMDDFGTGYSSLSYLKRFPFDQVKIDQSFIKGININNDDTVLVKIILSMAEHLNLSVVAEGVETYEQFAYLKALGCDRAQGFYFSRALPPDDFAESLFSSQFNSEIIFG